MAKLDDPVDIKCKKAKDCENRCSKCHKIKKKKPIPTTEDVMEEEEEEKQDEKLAVDDALTEDDVAVQGGVMKRLGICCTKPDCKVVLKRDRAMKQHLVSVHHLTPYQCYALGCNRQFAKRTQLSAHMDAEHRDNRIWVCYDCYRAFINVQLVRQHVFMHHQLGRFKCTSGQCSFVGKTRAQVYQHREKAHDSGELVKTNSD